MSVACWLIPFPLESFVKKPVPWTLISCQRPSWAIALEAMTRIPRTAAAIIFRIIFLFLPVLDFLHNNKTDSINADSTENLLSAIDWSKRHKLILAKTCMMRIPSAADANPP